MAVRLAALNGHHYLGTQEGETLVQDPVNAVYFPHGTPAAPQPFAIQQFTQQEADNFVSENIHQLQQLQKDGQRMFTDGEAAVISLHRLIAAKLGLISPRFVPQNFHVLYNDCIQQDEEHNVAVINNLAALLPAEMQRTVNETFVDRVSLVAFVFRGRGHHYLPDYEELYRRVWRKCRYDEGDVHISFQHLATAALHAIMPEILDTFWVDQSRHGHVNGALIKRVDVAPAGAAGPHVLHQGVLDLIMIAPGIRNRLEESLSYLDTVIAELSQHRFAGSVNHRYYGAPRVAFDEKRLGAVAATIKAALDQLTDDAPLGKSPALIRIARNAPITGAVLGRAIGNIQNRPEVINNLIEPGNQIVPMVQNPNVNG